MPDGPSIGAGLVPCAGCRGLVPDEEGPIHRYMTASPACWRIYAELNAGGLPAAPRAPLVADAYAVTHPGVPGAQSTPSVWIHLLTLCFALERGWPVDQAVRLRRLAADAFAGWPWLERPDAMGDISAVDVRRTLDDGDVRGAADLVERWVYGAWAAWAIHHDGVRARADDLTRRFLA
jgi:Family of unknown function (DUF5946)